VCLPFGCLEVKINKQLRALARAQIVGYKKDRFRGGTLIGDLPLAMKLTTHLSKYQAHPAYFVECFDFISMERLRWFFCISVSSSPLGFQMPRKRTSTAASCTFCQPWKRPR